MNESARAAIPDIPGLEGIKRLVIPSHPDSRTFIPFGNGTISVILSAFGEILRLSKYTTGEKSRFICLTSHCLEFYERDLVSVSQKLHDVSQMRGTGLNLRLMPNTEVSNAASDEPTPQVDWINGRWPRVYHEIDGLAISVLYTIHGEIVSQQYSISNPSENVKTVRYALQIGDSAVNTLSVNGSRWAGEDDVDVGYERPMVTPHGDGTFRIVERVREHTITELKQKKASKSNDQRGEATIAVFVDEKLVRSSAISPASIPRHTDEFDQEKINTVSKLLQIEPRTERKMELQYHLDFLGASDSGVSNHLDINSYLRESQAWSRCFKLDEGFGPIFVRHLEHILSFSVITSETSEQEAQISFIQDPTFESGSMALNDFYIFRYLLFMYRILPEVGLASSLNPPMGMPNSAESDYSDLRARIMQVCKGHLRQSFQVNTLLAKQSWPMPSVTTDNLDAPAEEPHGKAFIGSLQVLKLYEFTQLFMGEICVMDKFLQSCANLWLDALHAERDTKSKLWYKDTREAYAAWEGHRNEGSIWLNLPEYRLADLIFIWKALDCVDQMIRPLNNDPNAANILKRLKESRLWHADIKEIILRRFLYEEPISLPTKSVDPKKSGLPEEHIENAETNTSRFSIAVRRSRDKDRRLFYAKDTMLYDGIKWGFFQHNTDVETVTLENRATKANVQLAWQNTLQAQKVDREETWEKPLRYALAIIMADLLSLDTTRDSESLEKLSWERLSGCVLSCGLFAEQIDSQTKLPYLDGLPGLGTARSQWEIPTLLLRRKFKAIDLGLSEELPLRQVASNQSSPLKHSDDVGHETSPIPVNPLSRADRLAMKKLVRLEKKRKTSTRTLDSRMIADPPERRVRDWLYPLPDWISPKSSYKPIKEVEEELERRIPIDEGTEPENSRRKILESELRARLASDLGSDDDDDVRTVLEDVINRGIRKWREPKRHGGEEERFSWFNYAGVLIDVGQHQRDKPSQYIYDADDLDRHLCQARSVEVAKKRFHYIGPLQVEIALALYMASPTSDKRSMSRFYTRHSGFSSHFHEDVNPLADCWTTELHLSFLQLNTVTDEIDEERQVPDSDNICAGRQRRFPFLVKGSQLDVFKASVGYRVTGDMADKYWTSYLLLYLPKTDRRGLEYPENLHHRNSVVSWFHETTRNDQRRILEPFIVEKMVAEIYRSTGEIIRSIDDWLEPVDPSQAGQGSASSIYVKADDRNIDVQYNRSTTCLELDAILSVLRRLSKANVDSLTQWAKRESTRHHKPRWSEKDEYEHRELVDHRQRGAEQQISLLRDQSRQIQTCIEQLINNLNLTQSRTAAHDAENIRIFTYATVIFYPLSFVASLFSMQGPPAHNLISPFISAIAIALILTLLVVFNAEVFAWPFRSLRYSISQTARGKMEQTSNVFPVEWKRTLDSIKKAEEQDVLHDNRKPKLPRSKLVYTSFLVIHTLVEFPAHRIALAYRSLNGKHKKERLAVIIMQVFIASILLPVLIAAWLLVVTWSIMYTILYSFLTLPRAKWKAFQRRTENQVEAKERAEYEAVEKLKDLEAVKEDIKKEADRATIPEDKEDKKKQPKRKTSVDGFQEQRRQDRKKEEDQLREQIALLVNPKKLYESKIEGVISRQKQKIIKSTSSEGNEAASLRKSHEGDHESAGPITPPQGQRSIISTIMSVFQHRSDKAAESKEAV